jgi:hypothetical protein
MTKTNKTRIAVRVVDKASRASKVVVAKVASKVAVQVTWVASKAPVAQAAETKAVRVATRTKARVVEVVPEVVIAEDCSYLKKVKIRPASK